MRLPFEDHPLIKEYIEIKRYFRKFENPVSRERIRNFHQFSRILNQLGYEVAFDFVGSLNFGVTEPSSDVDFILYIRCDHDGECEEQTCPTYKEVYHLILHTLMQHYVGEPYKAQIVDCINLKKLDTELNKDENFDKELLFRFAFYRSIGRGVNLKILKPYHSRLLLKADLLKELENYIDEVIPLLHHSSNQHLSFEKYRIRLYENDIKISDSIIQKIKEYLYFSRHVAR